MGGEVEDLKNKKKLLVICLAVTLAVGGAAALLSMGSMEKFEALKQPPLSPPGWLFPVVWTILYLLMGTSAYLVASAEVDRATKRSALWSYGVQLAFNFVWPLLFFGLEWYLFAFVWLLALWIVILRTTIQFLNIRKTAGELLVPYLLWVAFAGYLNLGVYLLNPR